jgi:hypothetical protein
VLNLTVSLAVADDVKEHSYVSNPRAFECLLCDLDIWYDSQPKIVRCLHDKCE